VSRFKLDGHYMPSFIVDLVAETRGINDGEGNSSTLIVQIELYPIMYQPESSAGGVQQTYQL
jgi:hypothetical protein